MQLIMNIYIYIMHPGVLPYDPFWIANQSLGWFHTKIRFVLLTLFASVWKMFALHLHLCSLLNSNMLLLVLCFLIHPGARFLVLSYVNLLRNTNWCNSNASWSCKNRFTWCVSILPCINWSTGESWFYCCHQVDYRYPACWLFCSTLFDTVPSRNIFG